MKLFRKTLLALPLASLAASALPFLAMPADAAGVYLPVQRPDAPVLQYQRQQGVELRPLGHVNGIDSWLAKTKNGDILVMHVTPDGQALIVSGYIAGRSGDPRFNVTEDQISALLQSSQAQDPLGGKAEVAAPRQAAGIEAPSKPVVPDFFQQVLDLAAETERAEAAAAQATAGGQDGAPTQPSAQALPTAQPTSPQPTVTQPTAPQPAQPAAVAKALPMPSAEEIAQAEAQLADFEQLMSIEIGNPKAPAVHMIADPNCVYCSEAWKRLAPAVDAGKVRLKVALVAVLKQSSIGRNAAILQAADPALAFRQNEDGYGKSAKGEGGIATIEPSQVSIGIMRNNYRAMDKHGINITPYFVYRDKSGTPRITVGAENDLLDAMVGALH